VVDPNLPGIWVATPVCDPNCPPGTLAWMPLVAPSWWLLPTCSGTGTGTGTGSGTGSGGGGTIDTTCCHPVLLPASGHLTCISGCNDLAGTSGGAVFTSGPGSGPFDGWEFTLDDGGGNRIAGRISCYASDQWGFWGFSSCVGLGSFSYDPGLYANQQTNYVNLSCDPFYVEINLFLQHATIALTA
jgi:hypothetical protein